jgi:SET domain-containing protein
MPGTTVAPSRLHGAGDGLFAEKPFPQGAKIVTYDGDQHSFEGGADQAEKLAQRLADTGNTMVLILDDATVIDGSKGTQGAQFANHKPMSEANARMMGNTLYATRDIAVGEEICWCYGPHFGADGKLKATAKTSSSAKCHKKRGVDEHDPPARKCFKEGDNPVRRIAQVIISRRSERSS